MIIIYKAVKKNILCGYGLVVEHVLAKDETGVRFSLAALFGHEKLCVT